MCQNCLKSHCLNQKSLNKQNSHVKKKEKKKNKLLPNRFGNLLGKKTAVCGINVPNPPKVLFFEPKEKSHKRMVTPKFALQ